MSNSLPTTETLLHEMDALRELHATISRTTAAGREANFTYLCRAEKTGATSVVRRGAELSGVLGTSDALPTRTYDGFLAWKKDLVSLGVDGNRVVAIPFRWEENNAPWGDADAAMEARSLVRFMSLGNVRRVNVVAPAYDLVRTYASVVAAISEVQLDALAWPVAGKELPWDEQVAPPGDPRPPAPRYHHAFSSALSTISSYLRGSTTYSLPSSCLEHLQRARDAK